MTLFNPTHDALEADRRVLRALRAEVENLIAWQAKTEMDLTELTASTHRIAQVLDGLLGRGNGEDEEDTDGRR